MEKFDFTDDFKNMVGGVVISALYDSVYTEDEIMEELEKTNFDSSQTISNLSYFQVLKGDDLHDCIPEKELVEIPNAVYEITNSKNSVNETENFKQKYNINFHGYSVLSSMQIVTRLITDLREDEDFDITLNVGIGTHNRDQEQSETKIKVAELINSSKFRKYLSVDPRNEGFLKLKKSPNTPGKIINKSFMYNKKTKNPGLIYGQRDFEVRETKSDNKAEYPWVTYEITNELLAFELNDYEIFFDKDADNLPCSWVLECWSLVSPYEGFQEYYDWVILHSSANYQWQNLQNQRKRFEIANKILSRKYRFRMMGPNMKGEKILGIQKIELYGLLKH